MASSPYESGRSIGRLIAQAIGDMPDADCQAIREATERLADKPQDADE